MRRTTEPVAGRPKTRTGAIDPKELQHHVDRAHRLRVEVIAGLLRRGVGRLVWLVVGSVDGPRQDRPCGRARTATETIEETTP